MSANTQVFIKGVRATINDFICKRVIELNEKYGVIFEPSLFTEKLGGFAEIYLYGEILISISVIDTSKNDVRVNLTFFHLNHKSGRTDPFTCEVLNKIIKNDISVYIKLSDFVFRNDELHHEILNRVYNHKQTNES